LVDLAPLADPGLVPQAMAASLGIRELAGQPILSSLVAALKERHVLLVVDNCEHLVDACAHIIDALLTGCSQVWVLATSREPLRTAGEVPFRVPSLSLPEVTERSGGLPLEQLAGAEAVTLFVERAAGAAPGFALTAENAAAVVQICRRLDGVPLAIELAAARVRALTVQQIAARLDDRFRLLTGGSRTALPRQQTLRATLDWSYDLLTEPERIVLRRLAVFIGGWRLEAAEAVCAGDGVESSEVLDLLLRLVDRSLVQMDPVGADAHYRMLETIRQYARDRLAESDDDSEAAHRQHAAYYLDLAERATGGGPVASMAWVGRLRPEWGNLFAALRWAAGHGVLERALLLSGGFVELWTLGGQLTAARAWLAELLGLPDAQAATPERARALHCAGEVAWMLYDLAAAGDYYREAIAISRALGDRQRLADSMLMAGPVVAMAGDVGGGRALLEEALVLARAINSPREVLGALLYLGLIAFRQGEYERARALEEEALPAAHQSGDLRGVASVLDALGHIALAQGDYRQARMHYAESVATRRRLDFPSGWAFTLNGLAQLAAAEGRPARALRLAGAGARLAEEGGIATRRVQELGPPDRLASCWAALDSEAAAVAWAAGQGMTLEEAITEALTVDEPAVAMGTRPREEPAVAGPSSPLSARETAVAELIVQGMSSRQIAAELAISERTVHRHVENMLNKLGLATRAQIAAWLVAQRARAGTPHTG
jgi:non-specific serine/threonine protein kinase